MNDAFAKVVQVIDGPSDASGNCHGEGDGPNNGGQNAHEGLRDGNANDRIKHLDRLDA